MLHRFPHRNHRDGKQLFDNSVGLITSERIDKLDLLPKVFTTVLAPPAVQGRANSASGQASPARKASRVTPRTRSASNVVAHTTVR
jgi:hypothetical protein